MRAEGSNGSIEIKSDSVIIRRKGLANIITQGLQGDKQIPLKNITAVQFRAAGSVMAGVIQLTLLGGREFRGGMLEATKDENAVMFTRDQEPHFLLLRDAIQSAISQPGGSVINHVASAADELERLAALYEKGHLSADEFAEGKRQALSGAAIAQPSFSVGDLPSGAPTGPASDALPEKSEGFGCLKSIMILGIAFIGLAVVGSIIAPAPNWGEPGYRPRISEECRAAWVSMDVDSAALVRSVCTANEQHEIDGYRPE